MTTKHDMNALVDDAVTAGRKAVEAVRLLCEEDPTPDRLAALEQMKESQAKIEASAAEWRQLVAEVGAR